MNDKRLDLIVKSGNRNIFMSVLLVFDRILNRM